MQRKWILFSVAFTLLSLSAIKAADIRPVYGLDDVWKIALSNNLDVRIAEYQKYAAESGVTKAWGELFPKLDVNFIGTYYDRSVSLDFGGEKFEIFPRLSYTITGTVTQPIFTGGRIINGINLANAYKDMSYSSETMTKEMVYFGIAAVYYQVKMLEKEVEILERSIELSRNELSKAQLRFDVGEITKPAVLLADLTLKDTERKLIEQQSALQNAKLNLVFMTGINSEFDLAETDKIDEPLGTKNEMIQRALGQRQDMKMSNLSLDMADYQSNIAWGGLYPTIAIQGQYLNQSSVFPAQSYSSIGLIVSFPVFDGGKTYGAIGEARARATVAELEIANLRNQITIEVSKAYDDLETIKKTLETVKMQVDIAEENYQLNSSLYEVGDATALELAQALIAYDQAKITYSNLTYQKDLAVLNLKKSIGELFKTVK
jgi:outer membrane protein